MTKPIGRPFAPGLLALFLIASLFLSGCRQAQPQTINTTSSAAEIKIALETESTPPKVGKTTLIVTVRDGADKPIDNAKVEVRGDMSHAGMKPELGNASEGKDGRYAIPFEWTMGGDWIVVVTVTKADGKAFQQRFDLSVIR